MGMLKEVDGKISIDQCAVIDRGEWLLESRA